MIAWLASIALLAGCAADPPSVAPRREASHPCTMAGDRCDDGDPCTNDSCDVGAMTCRHVLSRPDCCDTASDCALLSCATGVCLLGSCVLDLLTCDAGMPDAGPRDAGPRLPDTGISLDASLPLDTGITLDAFLPDAPILPDAPLLDTGPTDAGPADAGPDAGSAADTGPRDTGPPDRDAGSFDAGARRIPHLRGGACSVGAAPPAASPWLVLLAITWLVRRRTTRNEPKARFRVALLLWFVPAVVSAQGFRLDRYAAPVAPDDLFWVERAASAPGSMVPWARVTATYADDPLVVEDQGTEIALIREQGAVHASAGLSFTDRLHLAVALPLVVQDGDEPDLGTGAPALDVSGAHLGDPRLDARVVLLDRRAPLELALAATLRIPIGGDDALVADRAVSVHPRLLLSRAFDGRGSHVSLGAGVDLRPEATVADLTVDDTLVLTAGLLYMATDRVGVSAELAASTILADAFAEPSTPLEATAGLRWVGPTGLVVGLGAGAGLSQGFGAPDARVLATAGFRPVPPRAPGAPPPPLDPDPDRDGVLDDADRCPDVAEDRDGFEDGDGCPDPDDDADGVLDAPDDCDREPEDRDAFEDDDGCPDPDNDADRILDAADGCPLEPEDADGWRDDDGCPEPDNDGDGLADASDQCPDEAETVNGTADDDGCPDFIRVAQGEIRTLEPVYFVTNRDTIQERSHPMLAEMARVLGANPELGRVSIEGHTDSVGSNSHNQRLSDRRAASVMRFLTEAGVAAERMTAVGFGETRPVAENDSAGGRALNRRVVFRLVDREAAAQSPAPPPAAPPEPTPTPAPAQ